MSLYNYGNFTLRLTDAQLSQNTIFSVPQSQFPFVIPPKQRKLLQVCYTPTKTSFISDADTLHFGFGCLHRQVQLLGLHTKEGVILSDDSRCVVPIKITTLNSPTVVFLQQNIPNPLHSGGETSICFGLSDKFPTSLEVYDLLGNRKAVLASGLFSAGVYEVAVNTLQLSAGVYIYRLHYGSEAISKIMIISE